MTDTTDLVKVDDYSPEVAALLAQQEDVLDEGSFQVPILKLCQALTKEVKEGDAEPGEFLNTLTSESYGTSIQFIAALFQEGRSTSVKSGGYRNAIEQDLIPDDAVWIEAVGEEFVGTRFDEHPDAEEMYKKAVNAGEFDWGKGPKISTTYNYTGLVVLEALEDDAEDEGPALMPVRISFQRSTKGAHDKIKTLKRSLLRNKPLWDVVFDFSTQTKAFGRNDSFIVNVKKARTSTTEERKFAAELAVAANAGRVSDNAETVGDVAATVAPDSKGGLEV